RESEGDQRSTGGEVRQPALLLLLGPREEDRECAQPLHRENQPACGIDSAELLDAEAAGQEICPDAPVLSRKRQAKDVVAREQLLDVPREFGALVDLGCAGRDALFG